MKKLSLFACSALLYATSAFATVSQQQCNEKGDEYIYAGKECIQFAVSEGEVEGALNIIVHGTWKEGTNTLGRYAPFAETLNMNTDITTVAVALPGYSDSSTNHLKSLSYNSDKVNSAATKEYVEFLSKLVEALKEKYEASIVNLIGHSAGGMMSATLVGYKPDLIQTVTVAGGRFDIHETTDKKGYISLIDYVDNVKQDTKILLVYGTEDKISKPEVTTKFYEIAKSKGLNVTLVKVEGAAHMDLDMTDPSVEAITEMVAQE